MNSKYHMTSQSQAKCPGRLEVLVDSSGSSTEGQERSGLDESVSIQVNEQIHSREQAPSSSDQKPPNREARSVTLPSLTLDSIPCQLRVGLKSGPQGLHQVVKCFACAALKCKIIHSECVICLCRAQ